MATQRGHTSAWRSATSAPAAVGSLLTLIVLFGWLGAWEGTVLFGWLTIGAVVLTRRGERIAVRVGCGFHRPSGQQAAVLAPLWARSLAYARLGDDEIDLYVHRSHDVNAFASVSRSIAVTSGAVELLLARRLEDSHLVAILVHEIGHLKTRGTRYALSTMFLTWPARVLSGLANKLVSASARQLPHCLTRAVVLVGVAVTIVRAVERHQWTVVLPLVGVVAAAVVCPLIDAAVSRHSEYQADRYAMSVGLGVHLALALDALDTGRDLRTSHGTRVARRHPGVADRIDRLTVLSRELPHEQGVSARLH